MELPVLPPCNRCGECCRKGGACDVRNWDRSGRSPFFRGRCEVLRDEPDGSTTCPILAEMDAADLKKWVPGVCDFPQWRRELVTGGGE